MMEIVIIIVVVVAVAISWTGGKSKPVDMGPAKPHTWPITQQDDYEYLTEIGVINGTPGRLSDAAVRDGINEALHGNYTSAQRYELLDNLTFAVHNNHADGMGANVLDEISRAIDKVQGR
jgi:hypothetical protein